jgi:hypothetical protein
LTKKEIAEFFGWNNVTLINRAFVKAEQFSDTISKKKGHYNKVRSIDYTPKEVELAMSFMDGCVYTPMMTRILLENFIYRTTPFAVKEKTLKLSREQQKFAFLYRYHKNIKQKFPLVCTSCRYLEPRSIKKAFSKPSPYCRYHELFLNKIKPKINILKDRCKEYQTIKKKTYPYIFTKDGVFSLYDFNVQTGVFRKKQMSHSLLSTQEQFSDKRKKDEPIMIVRDIFALPVNEDCCLHLPDMTE